MLSSNLCLLANRQSKEAFAVLCANTLTERKIAAVYDASSSFPLYLCPVSSAAQGNLKLASALTVNFAPRFLKALAATLDVQEVDKSGLPKGITAEDIFQYVYAVFHSPGYRSRYADFLRIDFPRLPLTSDMELFRKLAWLGSELVALHLLESPQLDRLVKTYTGPAKPEVEKVSHAQDTVWLDKAQTRGFRDVPLAVWNFHVAGYQVCEKWLKDRRGRTLSDEDISHYQRVVVALNETIRLMGEIDAVIEEHGGWPLVGSQDAPRPSEPDQLPFS